MSAITWRNLVEQRSGTPVQALQYANQNILGGLEMLDRTIGRYQEGEANKLAKEQNALTQNYLDVLQGARSPEEMAQLQQSGQAAALYQALNPEYRAKVRGADEIRQVSLRDQLVKGQVFDDSQRLRTEAPIKDQIKQLIAGGDYVSARKLMADNNLMNESELAQGLATAERQKIVDSQRDALHGLSVDNQKLTQERTQQQINVTDAEEKDRQQRRGESELVDRTLGAALTQYNAGQEQYQQGAKTLAKQMNLPLDRNGMPDIGALEEEAKNAPPGTTTRLDAFGIAMRNGGLDGVPSPSAAIDSIRKSLAGQPARVIKAAEDQAMAVLKGKTTLAPEDQARIENYGASLDTLEKDARQNNLFYTPEGQRSTEKEKVLQRVNSEIKDGDATKNRLKEKLTRWMDVGIEITDKDGKKVNVRVPPKVMNAALTAGLESSTLLVNSTDDNVLGLVKDYMMNPRYKADQEAADYLLRDGHVSDLNKFKRSVRESTGTVSPVDYAERLDDALRRRRATSK